MKHEILEEGAFGLTSAVITTLGLMVGLHSGTHSTLAVLGGILTIAVADAFSDALGIHVAKESEGIYTNRQIWTSTAITFATKFLFALTFIVPVLLFPLVTAILVSLIWGFTLLTLFSALMAHSKGTTMWKVIGEHLLIAATVILITHWIGDRLSTLGIL